MIGSFVDNVKIHDKMAETYTALGYMQLLADKSVKSGSYPKKYCVLQMALDINLNPKKIDAEKLIGMNMIRNVAEQEKVKPMDYMRTKAKKYIFEAAMTELVNELRSLGVKAYKAVKEDLRDARFGKPWGGSNVNEARELAELEIVLTEDLCDELPFDVIPNVIAKKISRYSEDDDYEHYDTTNWH